MKSHNILKFSRNSIVSLRCTCLLKKKQFCENPNGYGKRVSVYLLGQSSHVSVVAKFEGYTYSGACLEKVEKREDDETFKQHL